MQYQVFACVLVLFFASTIARAAVFNKINCTVGATKLKTAAFDFCECKNSTCFDSNVDTILSSANVTYGDLLVALVWNDTNIDLDLTIIKPRLATMISELRSNGTGIGPYIEDYYFNQTSPNSTLSGKYSIYVKANTNSATKFPCTLVIKNATSEIQITTILKYVNALPVLFYGFTI